MEPDELRRRWSRLHHGIDPASVPMLAPWLSLVWGLGRRLGGCGVAPTTVTVTGVVLAATAVGTARSRPLVAASCVVASALCDGLDGAVAVVADRATASGRRADAIADRCCDVAFAVVMGRCGASRTLTVSAAGLALGVDTLRRLVRRPDKITVAERPTFTICATSACLGAAATRDKWPATRSAQVWTAAGTTALVQLLLAARRATTDPPQR